VLFPRQAAPVSPPRDLRVMTNQPTAALRGQTAASASSPVPPGRARSPIEGLSWIEQLDGYEALSIDADGRLRTTAGLALLHAAR
jgi:hypothetical protein